MIRGWTASYTPALVVHSGQEVVPGAGDDEFPGWQWVQDASGLGGWVPEAIVDGTRIVSDFDTTELTVSMGETVAPLEARLGWVRARRADGAEGWLPETCLRAGIS